MKRKRSAGVAFLLLPPALGLSRTFRLQAVGSDAQDCRKLEQLGVSYAPELRFDLRNRAATEIEPVQLAFCGEFLLRQGKGVAPLLNLFANHVGGLSFSGHARAMRA
jgi:hypothetical protein